jgi:hypothetical protein
LGRKRTGRVKRHDDINPERDQLRCKLRKQIDVSSRRSEIEIDVLSFDIAKLSQAIAQLRPKGFGIRIAQEKSADPTHFRLLRAHVERPRCRRAAEKRDEFAPSQTIEPHVPLRFDDLIVS